MIKNWKFDSKTYWNETLTDKSFMFPVSSRHLYFILHNHNVVWNTMNIIMYVIFSQSINGKFKLTTLY